MNKFNQYILGLKFVFSYFTILPISFKEKDDLSAKNVLNSMLYFLPFMGFVLGVTVIFLYGFLENLEWFGALICAVVYMILYGFIHTEAILDVVDAIYAKHGGKDAYVVIKEPNVGAMGVLYALAFVILKLGAIVFLLLNNLFLEFISVLIISRFMLIFLIRVFEFKSTFVNLLKESLSFNGLLFSFIFTVLMIIVLSGFKSLFLLVLGFIFSFLIFKFIKKKLGFLNGDALGMTLELTEILLFIGITVLWF
ncbi:adenosylcobinamide-GDP ribazoletransferase [Arcobacter sp. LA11]|uniref:adenosylcobinamide-GDP ribazoletransferase n=1 Tax=Arcobacter sp. LA11 TaxID=1898176 RepID=UPI0009350709|nr:adenosylcobinamide-GDP ribazoletransferase [Arcobacter sp. LA11]